MADTDSDDMFNMVLDGMTYLNIKFLIILFIVYIFLHSDIFIEFGLSRFSNAVTNGTPSSKGYIILGIILVLVMVLANILINYDVI